MRVDFTFPVFQYSIKFTLRENIEKLKMPGIELSVDAATPTAELISHAVLALRAKTSIAGSLVTTDSLSTGGLEADAIVELQHPSGAHRYWVECKASIDRKAQLHQVRQHLQGRGIDGLLVTTYLSRELAAYCRETSLQFIDLSGNAYLHAPGLFVFIAGEKRSIARQAHGMPKGLTSAAALRVVFALLSQPLLLNSPLKDIASIAGVSLGTAHNVLNDLQRRGYLINPGGSGRKKMLESARLVDEWTINFPTTLRTKLHLRRFSAPDPEWWRSAQPEGFRCAWSSEVAAYKMTGYLKPSTQTLYVHREDSDSMVKVLVKQHRIRPDPHGSIEILEEFWPTQRGAEISLAPPLLVYAELLALMDPRTSETAHMIREKYIDPTLDQG